MNLRLEHLHEYIQQRFIRFSEADLEQVIEELKTDDRLKIHRDTMIKELKKERPDVRELGIQFLMVCHRVIMDEEKLLNEVKDELN